MVGRVVAALAASDPAKFFMPPYVAHHGYVGIYMDVPEGRLDRYTFDMSTTHEYGTASIIKVIPRICPYLRVRF